MPDSAPGIDIKTGVSINWECLKNSPAEQNLVDGKFNLS